MLYSNGPLSCLCKGNHFKSVFCYDNPPEGEVRFNFSKSDSYKREIFRCDLCGHYISKHNMKIGSFYTEDYVSSNYNDDKGIKKTFNTIIHLPPDKSDNLGRVRRILNFTETFFSPEKFKNRNPKILDVGSGLCVFLYEMKKNGWECVAVDPDKRNAKHAEKNVGIKAICNDFLQIKNTGKFDMIAFNKVLEHIEDPVTILSKSKEFIQKDGLIYIEVPDAEKAIKEGPEREEFFIDHHHIFSIVSLGLLVQRAGFEVILMRRLREPSSKYTIYCFISPVKTANSLNQS